MLSALRGRGPAILVAAWLVTCTLWLAPRLMIPDGAGYWSWLPSALLDRDLLFFNEWQSLGLAPDGRFLHQWVTDTLHLANHWGPGSAIAWAPGFLTGDLASRLPQFAGFPRDGFRLPHVAGGAVANAILALAAALLGRQAALRFAAPREATLAAGGVLFGSPLLYYALRGDFMAHAVGAFAAVVVVLLALKLRDRLDSEAAFACGLACGFAFAVRPQLVALLAMPLLVVPARALLGAPRALASLAGGLLLGALPQLVTNVAVYGDLAGALRGGPGPAGTPYAAFERFWTWEPYLSAWHGVVPWTPFLVVGAAGLVLLARQDARFALASGVVIASQAFAVAALDRPFWGARAFGQRRFDGLTGLLLVGAAVALARLPRAWAVAITVACSAWTLALFLASWDRIPLNEPVSMGEIAGAALAAVADPGAWARPLAGFPPGVRALGALALAASAVPLVIVAALVARSGPRLRLALAAAWLAACSAWLGGCALRDRARLAPWRALAEDNRQLGELSGAIDARIFMLRAEAAWFRRRALLEEAERVDARADELAAGLEEAVSRAGLGADATPP